MPLAHLTCCSLPLGLSAPSGPCWPGHFCTSQARVPDPVGDGTGGLCPAGHFCPAGSPEPQPCPSGSFLPHSGMGFQNSCLPCPAGKFCQGEGLAAASGGYCPHPILLLSQSGYFFCFKPNAEAFLLAGPCHAGYFCDPGSTQPDHRHCPAGFYCPEGSEFPIPCSPGSFSPASGKGQAADCQLCPAGHSCSGEDVLGLQGEERKENHPPQLHFRQLWVQQELSASHRF